MTTPSVPHHFEFEIEVPGSPDDVWQAIASAGGISSWMMPTDLDARLGGEVTFHMGPDDASHGHVTGFDPGRRIAYEEDWATLVGHAGADVTPLVTEFLVEARSGGTCLVRVVTSAFGEGADWEHEFWAEMNTGWAPMLDNLRLYLTHFPGQQAVTLWASTAFPVAPEAAITAVRNELGIPTTIGEPCSARDVTGRLERSIERHFLVRIEQPLTGLLSFYAFGTDTTSAVHMVGYLFSEGAAEYVTREQPAWQRWLETTAAEADVNASA